MTNLRTDPCRLCGAQSRFTFRQELLDREVDYFDCATCDYVQTEQPTWLKHAYSSAINTVDTGILWRNQLNVRRVIMTLLALGKLKGLVLDHAGGYGILVRMLRDAGVDARWRDKYCENLLARGFEADDGGADLVTAFEVFEHLEHPLVELRRLLETSPAVLISTELAPTDGVVPNWWYLGSEHGQHIGFFRHATLHYMAEQLACQLATDGRSLHLFSTRPIPTAWHILNLGKPLSGLVTRLAGLKSRTMQDFDLLRRRSP